MYPFYCFSCASAILVLTLHRHPKIGYPSSKKEIQNTQQMIEELFADKNVQKNTIYTHIKKLKSLQTQVDGYRNQKYRTELDIDSLKFLRSFRTNSILMK